MHLCARNILDLYSEHFRNYSTNNNVTHTNNVAASRTNRWNSIVDAKYAGGVVNSMAHKIQSMSSHWFVMLLSYSYARRYYS